MSPARVSASDVLAVFNLLAFLFVSKFLPETRGRTLEQIEEGVMTGTIYQARTGRTVQR